MYFVSLSLHETLFFLDDDSTLIDRYILVRRGALSLSFSAVMALLKSLHRVITRSLIPLSAQLFVFFHLYTLSESRERSPWRFSVYCILVFFWFSSKKTHYLRARAPFLRLHNRRRARGREYKRGKRHHHLGFSIVARRKWRKIASCSTRSSKYGPNVRSSFRCRRRRSTGTSFPHRARPPLTVL